MKKTISLVLCFAMLLCIALPANSADSATLSFSSDGKFRILHISDPQDDAYPAHDLQTFLRLAVESSDPDLIVLTGDLVEDSRLADFTSDDQMLVEGVVVEDIKGNKDHDKTVENIKKAVDNVFSVLEEYAIPYAMVQGNNDHKCGITNEEWLEIYSPYPHCIAFDMSDDDDSRIDYNLLINGTDGKAKFNLWMLDTGLHNLNDGQIEWYKTESAKITASNGGTPIPSFVFQHIHTDDIGNLFVECKPYEDGAKAIGTKFYRLDRSIASGKNVFAYEPGKTSKEFEAFKECGDVIGAYFGHQHVEGFTGKVDGIELGFTYGCEFAKLGPYGYRLFVLDENDVTNYTNELFTYEGSVKSNNSRFEKQEEPKTDEYSNILERVFAYIKNTIVSVVWIIVSLVA